MRKLKSLFAAFGLILGVMGALAQSDGGAQQALGYSYLSPLPGAQYCPAQTCFVLVRFAWEPPTAVTNLAQCIQVTGASSGLHPGTTRIASDNQTVIFQTPSAFTPNEIVTVTLTPQVEPHDEHPDPALSISVHDLRGLHECRHDHRPRR